MRYVGIGQSYLQCTAVLHGAVLVDPRSVTAPVVVSVALSSAAIQSTAVHCHVPQTVWRERAVHYSVRACVCPISLHVSCRRPTSVYCRSAAVAAGYERPGRAGQSAGGWAATEECPLPARGDGARRVTDRRRGGGHGDYASTRYHRRRRVCDFPPPRETDEAVPLWSPAGRLTATRSSRQRVILHHAGYRQPQTHTAKKLTTRHLLAEPDPNQVPDPKL